jgi:ech hydrogenase subunit D
MADSTNTITQIPLDELLPKAMEKKAANWRLGQICSVCKNDQFELSYSFVDGYQLDTYRIIIDQETQVPSITSIYDCAFLYENEMKELFGVKMEYIGLDYQNKLYRIDQVTPFLKKEEK